MKVFFVTGASRGIGKALCEALLEDEKHQVVGISRGASIVHERYTHLNLDLSESKSLHAFVFPEFENVEAYHLINNAGTIGEIRHLGNVQNESIARSIFLNLTAPAILMNVFLKQFAPRDLVLKILNISSGAASRPIESWSSYCASKAGLDMFSQVLHLEQQLKPNNKVSIWSLAPGIIETQMQEEIRATSTADFSGVGHFRELKEQMRLKSPNQTAAQLVNLLISADENKEPLKRLD